MADRHCGLEGEEGTLFDAAILCRTAASHATADAWCAAHILVGRGPLETEKMFAAVP